MKHAAIPTLYRGIQFRSRLEARWAACFDGLGWRWDYEPLDLNGWIPDFALDFPCRFRRPIIVEIKPVFRSQEDRAAIVKIEQALGAPPPREIRGETNPYPGGWDEFFENLQYDVLLFGVHPFREPDFCTRYYEDGSFDYYEVPGPLTIGWHLDSGMGWWPVSDLCEPDRLTAAWKQATNAVQWRAPR